jgi:sulfane dehydrogenase subunit SoxC
MFTMDDLKRLPSVSRIHYVACAGQINLGLGSRLNAKTVQQTHGLTGCSVWTGVLLSTVLEMAGVQKGGEWISSESVDAKKHAMSLPMEVAMRDVILAYSQNGGPVRPELGYPLKMVVPGSEGTRNIKWLRRIKVVDQPQMTNYEIKCYANWQKSDGKGRWMQVEMEPGGVITYPSGAQQLSGRGFYEIRGIAWSGGGAVHRVEVSTDGGRTWKDAQLHAPVVSKAHTWFTLPWNWDGKEAVLMSRTTDEKGDIQPALSELTKIWKVTPNYWTTSTNRIQHFNGIQPWRVDTDGKVTNGMFHPSNNV